MKVESGQIWENCDPRYAGREFQILLVREDLGYAQVRMVQTGRLRRIAIHRFVERSNGYRLVVAKK